MKNRLLNGVFSPNKITFVLVFFLSLASSSKTRVSAFVSPLSLLGGGRGGIEIYLGKRWALGSEYSYQNTFIDDSTVYDPYLFFLPKAQGGDISSHYGPRLSFFFKGSDQKSFYLLLKVLKSSTEVLYANETLNYTQETTMGVFALGYSYPKKRWFYRLNMGAGSYISDIQRKDSQTKQVAANVPPLYIFADFETGVSF